MIANFMNPAFWKMQQRWYLFVFDRCCSAHRQRLAIGGWDLQRNTALCSLQLGWEMSDKSVCWVWLQNDTALVAPTDVRPCCQSCEALKTKLQGRWEAKSVGNFFLFINDSSFTESYVLALLWQEFVLPLLSPRCVWGSGSALSKALQGLYT